VVPTHAAHHATDTAAADDAYSTSRPGPTEDIESAEPRAAHPATNSAGRPSAARSRRHASVSNFQTAHVGATIRNPIGRKLGAAGYAPNPTTGEIKIVEVKRLP
jgi:hypothetical protein